MTCPQGQAGASSGLGSNKKACAACASGKFGKMVHAPHVARGLYPFQSSCMDCPLGKYQARSGHTHCRWCDPGQVTDKTSGSVRCQSCSAGKYAHEATQCRRCPGGKFSKMKYSPVTLDSIPGCVHCPGGKYQQLPGIHSCAACAAGRISSSRLPHSLVMAQKCPPGKFQPLIGQNSCHVCSAKIQPLSGATGCLACPAGKGPAANHTLCAHCSAGRFLSRKSCKACEAGTFQPWAGQHSCMQCSAGKATVQAGLTSCTVCDAGRVAETSRNGGANSCTACAAGMFSAGAGSADCRQCPSGTFSVAGKTTCTPCPPGKYSGLSEEGRQHFLQTGDLGLIKVPATCPNCPPGRYQSKSGQRDCFICSIGWYCPGKARRECPYGKFTKVQGQTACSAMNCPVGKHQLASTDLHNLGNSNCAGCAVGRYGSKIGLRNGCVVCPGGKFQPYTGFTFCASCPVGKFQLKFGAGNCSLGEPMSVYTTMKEEKRMAVSQGKVCAPPHELINGVIESISTDGLEDSVVKYKCNVFFSMHGSHTRTCTKELRWSGSPPTCVPQMYVKLNRKFSASSDPSSGGGW